MSKSTLALINEIKTENQDFEFYPTTTDMLQCIEKDIKKSYLIRDGEEIKESILDCGAGDGRALMALTKGDKYAIEKSRPLLDSLPKEVFIVGTDFHQQTLLDKKVSVVFVNPPYSEYSSWITKIIKEANAQLVYAVIPERWERNEPIKRELEARKATATVIGEFDFLEADRKARGTVNVVRFSLVDMYRGYIGQNQSCSIDPFELWFNDSFNIGTQERSSDLDKYSAKKEAERNLEKSKKDYELTKNKSYVKILEDCYIKDMDKLMMTYKALADIDPQLMNELDVKFENVKSALRLKVSSLKDVYWHELINKLSAITSKLASSSRKALLDKLFSRTHVDFTAENAHAIVIWVIKNANAYFDSQLIELVETMTEKANVVNYKSNKRTFGSEDWRYRTSPSELSRYKLDYRIVLERVGGISVPSYWQSREVHGLSNSATNFINDICTVAFNIGYDTEGMQRAEDFKWESNKKKLFMFKNHSSGETEELFEVKAFKNGNLHIKLRPSFICKLNVEFGRLKGWLKTKEEASSELGMGIEEVNGAFKSNFQIPTSSALRLIAA